MKKSTKILIAAALLLAVIGAIPQLIRVSGQEREFAPGYSYYDNSEDMTEYLDRVSPYRKAGKNVYCYVYNSSQRNNNLAIVNIRTGKTRILCTDEQCGHHSPGRTDHLCRLWNFRTDLDSDEQGYVYGYTFSYDRTSSTPAYEVVRYNLGTDDFQVLYVPERDAYGVWQANNIAFVTRMRDEAVYFYEQQLDKSWRLKRISMHRGEVTDLTPDGTTLPEQFRIFGDALYLFDGQKFYSYDRDFTPESRELLIDCTAREFAGKVVENLQYDPSAHFVYFQCSTYLRSELYNSTLWRVPARESERKSLPTRLNALGLVSWYQLTDDYVYYKKLLVSPIVTQDIARNEKTGEESVLSKTWYDDGKIYALSYTALRYEEDGEEQAAPEGALVFEPEEEMHYNHTTIIGSYLYVARLDIVPLDVFGNPGWSIAAQVRVNLRTGEVTELIELE